MSRNGLLEAIGPMGVAGTRSRDRSMREAGGVLFQAHRLRQQLRPFAGEDGEPDFASPVPYPEGDHDFPEKLAGVAAMLAYGLPLGCIALEGIARPLDIGVQGLMIPNVRTADQARRVVDCAKHPPVGNRSVWDSLFGLVRRRGFGGNNGEDEPRAVDHRPNRVGRES